MLDHVRTALAARDQTEQRLRRFVADASHELRTPLATIAATPSTRPAPATPCPRRRRRRSARIDAAAARMTTLVDDLLLLARLDAGRPLDREPVDLSQLVLETVDDARTAAPDHLWHLDLPEDPIEVTGDEQRLHQVLANLLGNARLHTPAGTTVTHHPVGGRPTARIEVCDDGPGIPDALLPDLFDRFTRADAAPARPGTAAAASDWPSPAASPWPTAAPSRSRAGRAAPASASACRVPNRAPPDRSGRTDATAPLHRQ